ncbi:MAG: hypothetical protein OJF52_002539 [Nitrospira sp.]|jgi:hypothetical protein|nr:MAG: hypothetical protein OJF52_002539 [Nitrospira sp.]
MADDVIRNKAASIEHRPLRIAIITKHLNNLRSFSSTIVKTCA